VTALFRVVGTVETMSRADLRLLCDRGGTTSGTAVRDRTTAIIRRVREDGDNALRALARELDGVSLPALEIPMAAWHAALKELDAALRRAMERAAQNIRAAHEAIRPAGLEVETEPGIVVGRRPDPLRRVGVYAPGGRAAYASSLLMAAIPARVAGVREIIVCSPPERSGVPGSGVPGSGMPAPTVLAAAALAGADRVFAVGGAGAIAAMAYGTASVPRVDRIVGPGNAYVAEAKMQVASVVGIDCPAGPSELLVIADESATPDVVAREVIAQAEHDPDAAVVVIAIGESTATKVADAVASLLPSTTRRTVVESALAARGALLAAGALPTAIEWANVWAPEHLLLAVADPAAAFGGVRSAGTVCLGEQSSVTFGDYMTGANHVLPTAGLARTYSGLSTLDFVRWTTYQRVNRAAAARLAGDVATFAEAEGLPGHAAAAQQWAIQ
jgi:histidinol dehydrogenase